MRRELTKEDLERLERKGELLAIIVSPRLLAEMLGSPINKDGDILLDSVTTSDEHLHSAGREFLSVSPTLMLVQRNETPSGP